MKNVLILTVLILNIGLFAQDKNEQNVTNECGTMEVLERLIKQDPSYKDRLNALEVAIAEYLKENPGSPRELKTIPVVVHVVYKAADQNIPDAQILDQIRILNEDFTKTNSDTSKVPDWFKPFAGDSQIKFKLATKDPRGRNTNGIVRKTTKKSSFTTNDDVKFKSRGGSNAWPTNKYLNIWVCNLDQGGILGYAVFPGSGYINGDGIVVDFQAFGISSNNFPNKNLGRVATHEVGHWLNLRHTWGDDGTACTGTDYVDDTPNQAGPNGGGYTINSIIISCENGPYGDMWMNYMDYAWDISNYLFTIGQADRMNAIFATDPRRASLLTSPGLNSPLANTNYEEKSITVDNYPNPFNPSTIIKYSLPDNQRVLLRVYDILGREVATLVDEFKEAGYHEANFDASHLASGLYFYKIDAGEFTAVKKMILTK